jgi:hypothetical protein
MRGGLDDFSTPTSCPSTKVPGSSTSSMLPPTVVTSKTPIVFGRPEKKWKRNTITSFMKQMVVIQQQIA